MRILKAPLVAHNFLFDFKDICAEFLKNNISTNNFEDKAIYDKMTFNVNLCFLHTSR